MCKCPVAATCVVSDGEPVGQTQPEPEAGLGEPVGETQPEPEAGLGEPVGQTQPEPEAGLSVGTSLTSSDSS